MLGFVSLLTDMPSELIHNLLPMFMVTTLGASIFSVDLIEGLAESTALIVKIFSGTLSDYLGKRKELALWLAIHKPSVSFQAFTVEPESDACHASPAITMNGYSVASYGLVCDEVSSSRLMILS